VNLTDAVRTYLGLTGGFDRPLHLSQFGLGKNETERIFSAWDEDYQISRYMVLSREGEDMLGEYPDDVRVFHINGQESTHVRFRPGIQQFLASP